MAHSPDSASSRSGTGKVREYYSRTGLPVIVIRVTLGLPLLLSLGSTLSAILEAGAALIVLGAS